MRVSNAISHGHILFSSLNYILSQTVNKVLEENGIPSDTFSIGRDGHQYLEFPNYEAIEEFCKAMCPHIDDYFIKKSFHGGLKNDADVQRVKDSLSASSLATLNYECRFTGSTCFSRRGNLIEFTRPAEVRFYDTVIRESYIILDGKTYTNTERFPVYSDWYQSLPLTCMMDIKPYFRTYISND
jgi:hypothetical protein